MDDSSVSGDSASRSSDADSSAEADSTVNEVAEAVSAASQNTSTNDPNATANEMLKRENALREERLGRWSSNKGKGGKKPSDIDPRLIDLALIRQTRRPSTKSLVNRFQHSTLRQRGTVQVQDESSDETPLLSNNNNNNNNDTNISTKPFPRSGGSNNNNSNSSMKRSKADIVDEMSHRRILYEMNLYDNKWFWIDTLPTDDNNDYLWLEQVTNINHMKDSGSSTITMKTRSNRQTQNDNVTAGGGSGGSSGSGSDGTGDDTSDEKGNDKDKGILKGDIIIDFDGETQIEQRILGNSNLEVMSIQDFNYIVDEARKACINEPLYPKLGCCGYCKEFYVNLCDWSHLGVLSIQCRYIFF